MLASRLTRLLAPLALVLPLAGAPALAADMGPDRTEALMDDAKIREFEAFFPAAPAGWERDMAPGVWLAESGSTISYTYFATEPGGGAFTITFTFSNENVAQNLDLMGNESNRDMWGYGLTEVNGYTALTPKERGMGKADLLVVVSNSRAVSIMPVSDPAPAMETVTAIFSSLDFAGIAAKE